MKKNKKGIVDLALYADDSLLVVNPEAINEAIKLLSKNGLVLKLLDGLQDYLSFKVKTTTGMARAWELSKVVDGVNKTAFHKIHDMIKSNGNKRGSQIFSVLVVAIMQEI